MTREEYYKAWHNYRSSHGWSEEYSDNVWKGSPIFEKIHLDRYCDSDPRSLKLTILVRRQTSRNFTKGMLVGLTLPARRWFRYE